MQHVHKNEELKLALLCKDENPPHQTHTTISVYRTRYVPTLHIRCNQKLTWTHVHNRLV